MAYISPELYIPLEVNMPAIFNWKKRKIATADTLSVLSKVPKEARAL